MKILNKMMKFTALLLIIVMQFVFIPPLQKAYAATSPGLGTAAAYSILAGSQVTNTGATTVSGDVGISPGTTPPNYTGFGTVTLGGTIHDADGAALTAMGDRTTAYDALASQGCNTTYAGTKDLAGETLVPGVYCADSFHLTGTLTLNGSASEVWIFKSASDLILTGGTAVKVVFTGSGQPCNVWWRVVSTATFDANSTLVGNILADTSITFAAGASLNGRALARTAEVTLSSNSITGPTCVSSPTPTPTPGNGFNFPSCPDVLLNPGDKAHYTSGNQQIVGGSLLSGSDDVYSLENNNFLQCFCPADGNQGIQTNWLRTDSPIASFPFFVNGTQWNLGNVNYAVQNIDFTCQSTPNSSTNGYNNNFNNGYDNGFNNGYNNNFNGYNNNYNNNFNNGYNNNYNNNFNNLFNWINNTINSLL